MPQTQSAPIASPRWWLAAACYGLLVYACLPAGVAALDDDFGYLRSVIATLQHGRPWTDDRLEPWAASFSSLSALLYLLRFKTEADAPAAVHLPPDYRARPFPLSEAEWRETISPSPQSSG